jgi:hypothetical protein
MRPAQTTSPKKKKKKKHPISNNKPNTVVHTCNPSYLDGISRRIMVQGQPRKKHKNLPEK